MFRTHNGTFLNYGNEAYGKKIKVMVYGKIKIDSRNPEVTVSRLLIHKRLYEHTCSVDQGLKRILFHL